MGTESRLRRRHRDAIRAAYPHALVVSQPASAFTGAGRTDFYVIVEGKYVGLELKTSTGRATDAQNIHLALVRTAGGYADVVRHPDQSLALIRHALAGGSVWDNLFNDDEWREVKTDEPRLDEIRAFKEPEIQRETELNGVAPAGDGAMIEPPADYPFGVIIQRLERLESLVRYFMQEAGVAAEVTAEESAAPEPDQEEQPKPKRSRRKG